MLIPILIFIFIFIIYLEYKEKRKTKKDKILELLEIKNLSNKCNPEILKIFNNLTKYDKRLIQIYINDIIDMEFEKKEDIDKNELYNKFKSTSYVVCSKYILDMLSDNKFLNIPLSSTLGYICQSIL